MLEREDLVDTRTAAELLSVSVRHLYRLSRDGLVPSVRVGRLTRYSRRSLGDFVAAGGATWPGGWRRSAVPADVVADRGRGDR